MKVLRIEEIRLFFLVEPADQVERLAAFQRALLGGECLDKGFASGVFTQRQEAFPRPNQPDSNIAISAAVAFRLTSIEAPLAYTRPRHVVTRPLPG